MHFTYSDSDLEQLRQGDLLRRTEMLEGVLRSVHPYFVNTKYKFFIVLTQSCDLERRDREACKARYISIAAVRPLSVVVNRELDRFRKYPDIERAAGIAELSARNRFQNFLTNLLNNNDNRYFYLHDDPGSGLAPPHCALLRVSVALRSDHHYQTCLDAKMLQLKPEFQAKLGWLTGNLYSRVGTDDWSSTDELANQLKTLTKEIIEREAIWLEKRRHEALLRELKSVTGVVTPQLAKAKLEAIKVETGRQATLRRLREILSEHVAQRHTVDNLMRLIESDQTIKQFTKP